MARCKKRQKYFIEVPGIFPRSSSVNTDGTRTPFPADAKFEASRIAAAPNLYAVLRVLPCATRAHIADHRERLSVALADDAARERVRFAGDALGNPLKRAAYDLWRWLEVNEEKEEQMEDHELYEKWLATQNNVLMPCLLRFLLGAKGWCWIPASLMLALVIPLMAVLFLILFVTGMIYATLETMVPDAFGGNSST